LEKELIVSIYNGKTVSHRVSYNRSAGRLLTGSGQHMDMPSFPDYAPLGRCGFRTAGRVGW
jgi:hypothetical protein